MNPNRLWNRLQALAEIGATPEGGVTRPAYTPELLAAEERLRPWLEAAGLTVRRDAAGNLLARWAGTEEALAPVWVGSHLDTVPNGGKFDGALGVLAALEAIQLLQSEGFRPRRPIELVSFQNEEGTRFPGGLTGSTFVAGGDPDRLLALQDAEGLTLAEALRALGLDPSSAHTAARGPGEVHAYLELHIEQARRLERADRSVAVVTGIAGPAFGKVTLRGRADHAGATPMDERIDAMCAAAEAVLALEEAVRMVNATQPPERAGTATVGWLTALPGAANVIPAEVRFTVDCRHIDLVLRQQVLDRFVKALDGLAARRGVEALIEWDKAVPPMVTPPEMLAVLEEAMAAAGEPPFRTVSGAAHDAMQMARICPSGMLFVRSREGASHSPREYTSPEDCWRGARVMAEALRRLSG